MNRLKVLVVAVAVFASACVGARVEVIEREPETTTPSTALANEAVQPFELAAAPDGPLPATSPPSTSPPPTTSAEPADNAAPERGRLVIHATGDVNVDPDYIEAFGEDGYTSALSGVGDLFIDDSLTIINLECPISGPGTPADKAFVFLCDPSAIGPLASGGVDVANLANNHILDHGPEALLESIELLREGGIAPVGAGEDAASAAQPAIFERAGWTIAVVGFGGVIPARSWIATEDRPGMADGDTVETMVATVEAAAAIADLVFVTVHWGVELDTTPRADDIARAEAMIAAGADAIFGHHSHRLNTMETLNGVPVAWGLGNFVWPRLSAAGATTAVARIVVDPDGTVVGCLLPAEIVRSGHPELTTTAGPECPPPGI